MPYILAHDLGTTGDKATLYDEAGRLAASLSYTYATDFPRTGWAEQSAEEWWGVVCTATRDLLATTGVTGAQIACITFSGQMQGVVALGANARPLRPAIIWMDSRATVQVRELEARISVQDVYRITGHRLSAAYSLAKILWIRDNEPELFARTHKFVCAKDAIIARLTGEFVTDPSDASGMNLYDLKTGEWSAPILEAAGLDRAKLPQILYSIFNVGGIRDDVAAQLGLLAGTPVVLGGGDGACASVGAGSVREGVAYSYVGTSAWIATAAREPVIDATMRVFTFGHVVPDLVIPMGTMQTAGAAYQWARDQLADPQILQDGKAFELMNILAEAAPPGANDLLFLPYLAGERAPRWNPDARANFIGLTIRHTRADMLRAVLEGVAYNMRLILDILNAQSGAIDSIRVIGGGSSARLWAQIMADVYGIPLQRLVRLEEATSMGAAVIGGVGCGMYPGFEVALTMNPIAETVVPEPANRELYNRMVRIFDRSYAALEPIFADLARTGNAE